MKKGKEEEKEKKKYCPFDRTLECEDCKLFTPYISGRGERACSIILIAGK